MKNSSFSPIFLVVSTFLATAVLQGCLSDASPSDDSGQDAGSLELRISAMPQTVPAAGRALSAEPGSRLVAQIKLPGRTWADSAQWTGASPASFAFGSIPASGSYCVKVLMRDPAGRITHCDSAYPVSVVSGRSTPVQLELRAVLGKIVVAIPSVPASVESLSISWEANQPRRSVAARGPSGKTTLRLDSLPVGSTGIIHLRAWGPSKDTLFRCDSSLSVNSQQDQSLSLRWTDATGSIQVSGSVAGGGDVLATALFPADASSDGSLRFLAFSDSGSSDWVRIENPGSQRIAGSVSIVHGSESTTANVDLGPGESLVLSRIACSDTAGPTRPLHEAGLLICGLALSVSWSNLPAVWELRAPSGALADRVMVEDAKDGWPDLNASTARTLRRRTGAAGSDAMAGRSWCADGSDSPTASCP